MLAMLAATDDARGRLQPRGVAACIGLCTSERGVLTRVLNASMTPATHPALTLAAPGQVSVSQIMRQLHVLAMVLVQQLLLLAFEW